MASANKSSVKKATPSKAPSKAVTKAPAKVSGASDRTVIDFLPDADEIERRPLPLVARITLHILLACMVSFALWATLSEVDLVVSARGKLITPLPNVVVQPLETSIIQTIDVKMGQVVRKGQRLATLDPTFTQADEQQLRNRMESLSTQAAAIEAELSGRQPPAGFGTSSDSGIQMRLSSERQATHASQLRKQSESIARLRSALDTARQDELALGNRVKVLREMEGTTEDLVNKKLAVRSRLLEVRDRLLEAERGVEMARNRQIELRRELSSVEAEKASFETGWRQKMLEDLLNVSRERDALHEQIQKANRRSSMVELTAPVDAVVQEIAKLSQGSIVREAEPFFTLVPISDVLEAEVQIDPRDIGYIKAGDSSQIKIDAYPFQKHGTLAGHLRIISHDAFKRDSRGLTDSDSYYNARVTLQSMRLDSMPERSQLLPGMTLSAEIQVGKRSIMTYLLWPLTKAFKESIREP